MQKKNLKVACLQSVSLSLHTDIALCSTHLWHSVQPAAVPCALAVMLLAQDMSQHPSLQGPGDAVLAVRPDGMKAA